MIFSSFSKRDLPKGIFTIDSKKKQGKLEYFISF